jgi:sporulation protein YqfC
MGFVKKIVNYIEDREMKLVIENNTVKIINYLEIVKFEENIIVIKHNDGVINITGQNLFVAKLLTKEILIGGNIKTIELG